MRTTTVGVGGLTWALVLTGCGSPQPDEEHESGAGVVASALCGRTPLPNPSPADSWRWGGGHGYPDIVSPTCADVVIVHGSQGANHLKTTIEGAPPGRVVYIDGAAELDLTNQTISVPSNVWVASNRGQVIGGVAAPGALLKAEAGSSSARTGRRGVTIRPAPAP